MAVVKMYRATDGSLHETYEAYAKHVEELKIAAEIGAAALDKSAFVAGDADSLVLPEENIAFFVIANASTLREILNGSQVVRRGRKGGAKKAEQPAEA